MGLGKTIQTLALIQRERERRRAQAGAAGLPDVGGRNWQKEAARFTPELPVMVHHGSSAQTRDRLPRKRRRARAGALQLCAAAPRLRDALRQVHWAGVILDEAQNIKNPQTKQAQAARSLQAGLPHRPHRHAGREPRRRPLVDRWSSSTPAARHRRPSSQADVLRPDPGVLATPRPPSACVASPAPFILRRLKTDKSDHRRPAREAGDEGLLHADEGAGVALRSRGRRRPKRRSNRAEGIERKGHRPGDAARS